MRRVVLLMLMLVAVAGSQSGFVKQSVEHGSFGGPVCYPGDPCGPFPTLFGGNGQ